MMRLLMMSVLAVALVGCASNVVTDYDSSTAFDRYSTWAFAPDAGDTSFMSLDGSRVQAAVERELSEKSLSKVAADKADLLVNWDIEEEKSHERSGVGLGFGFGTGNFGWGMSSPPPVREVKEGKLVIQLVDSANDQVVWRSASRRYLNENQSPEDRRKLINEVVKEMFSKYPPGLD